MTYTPSTTSNWHWTHLMAFAKRLSDLRKERGVTQPQMADIAGVHVSQIRRYENGSTQPTLEVLRNIASALNISADVLVFDESESGPQTDDLKLAFEAVSQFDPEDKAMAKKIIQGLIMQHQNKRLSAALDAKTGRPLLGGRAASSLAAHSAGFSRLAPVAALGEVYSSSNDQTLSAVPAPS